MINSDIYIYIYIYIILYNNYQILTAVEGDTLGYQV